MKHHIIIEKFYLTIQINDILICFRLHEEIEQFYRYMSPTDTEHLVRGHAVRRISDAVRRLWSHARVEVFGSYRTGLYLPTSDIDLVVIGKKSFSFLKRMLLYMYVSAMS